MSANTDTIVYAGLAELERAGSEPDRAATVARIIADVFEDYYIVSRGIPARAKRAFETRDWQQSIALSHERLAIYRNSAVAAAELLKLYCPEDDRYWDLVQQQYLTLIAGLYQADLAFAFLNSVRRQINQDQWKASDFHSATDASHPGPSAPLTRTVDFESEIGAATITNLLDLAGFQAPFADLDADACRTADHLNRVLDLPDDRARFRGRIEMINAGFFRNRGAYLVGRLSLDDGSHRPLALALLHDETGIKVDAVITQSDDLQFVFSSTLANFHVTHDAYHELTDFLFSIMPKRPKGLHYSTVGFNHVGKVLVMRQVEEELAEFDERLDHAVGAPGSVAIGFSAPSSDYVLKVIRDQPTANYKWDVFDGVDSVLARYRQVHDINRAGSMLDNIIYYNITLPEAYFAPALLDEILVESPGNVTRYRDDIFFKHLIIQMKMVPLPEFLRQASEDEAETAVINLGQCIKNNAAANIFNKDLDGRNYGVSPIRKVYLFDYDAVEDLTGVKVRTNLDRVEGDEDIPEWFFEDGYVFLPEEIETHLRIEDRNLRRLFRQIHGDLLTTQYWEDIQQLMRQKRIPPLIPYPDACRL